MNIKYIEQNCINYFISINMARLGVMGKLKKVISQQGKAVEKKEKVVGKQEKVMHQRDNLINNNVRKAKQYAALPFGGEVL